MDYIIDDINLDDYKFLEFPKDEKIIKYKLPTELKYSTITSNVCLIPIIDNLEEKINLFRNKYLSKYQTIDKLIDYNLLKFIYINRIIIDNIKPEVFFETLNEKFQKKNNDIIKLVSTILNISTSNFIDINLIYENIILDKETVSSVFMRNKDTKSIDNYKNIKKGFRNQISFRMKTEDKERIVNIMIFQNGKMTLTGCRNIEDINFISLFIKNFINNFKILDKSACLYNLITSDIIFHSINCHFNLNFNINNKVLYNILKEYPETDFLMYKPNTYPGLKCRFKEDIEKKYKGGLIIFFQSGKINIYRTNNFNEIDYLYKFINDLIKIHYEKLYIEN